MSVSASTGINVGNVQSSSPRYTATDSKKKRPLTARGEVLPKEYVATDGTPLSWGKCSAYLTTDLQDGPTEMRFNGSDGKFTVQNHSRGSEQWANSRYSELKRLDRAAMASFSHPTTILFSFTGTPRNAVGGLRSPVDHAKDVLESTDAVYTALRRALDGKEYLKAKIVAPHDSGYLHWHLAVWIDGSVSKEELHPVVDAHVQNSCVARQEHHSYADAITVESHGGARDGYESGLSTYIGSDMVGIDGDVHESDNNGALLGTVTMRAANINTVSMPRDWKQRLDLETNDSDSDTDVEFVGIVDDSGNVIETDSDTGEGGIDWVQPRALPKADPVD